MHKLSLSASLLMALLATPAHAYIGPGAGAGAIAVVLGVIALRSSSLFWQSSGIRSSVYLESEKQKQRKMKQRYQISNDLDTDNGSLHHPDRIRDSNSSPRDYIGDKYSHS